MTRRRAIALVAVSVALLAAAGYALAAGEPRVYVEYDDPEEYEVEVMTEGFPVGWDPYAP